MTSRHAWVVAVAAFAAPACGGDEPGPEPAPATPVVAFDTVPGAVVTTTDSIPLTLELADTDTRRAYGLMERPSLPTHHGMLFVYPAPQPAENPFYMFRTLIPLDIAFVDEAGRIVAILTMTPCESPNPAVCRRYAPGVAYSGALEVGAGVLEGWGVGLGDRVVPAPASRTP